MYTDKDDFRSNSSIKVCVLSSVHTTFDVRIFQKQCRSFVKAGFEVVFITPHDKDEVVDGIKIKSLPHPKTRIERITKTTWQIYKIAQQEKADIYHIHDVELLPWGQILRFHGKKVIYDMHENFPKMLLTKEWIFPFFRLPISFIYKFIEKLLIKGFYIIYAENSYVKEYSWITHNQIVLLNLPNVNHLLGIRSVKETYPTITYMGNVTEERGSIVTLKALQILKEKGYNIQWECIGSVWSEAHLLELLDLCKEYQLKGVKFRGYMLPDEGWKIVAKCHIGIAILQPTPNQIDSYPTKMFEYMALGLPIVVSDFPLYREVVEKHQCGICINPEDPKEVARAIQWLLDHPEEGEKMGKRGKNAVTLYYNWNVEEDKLINFYTKILN